MTRIGYLVSDYDAPSHTFVRREVAALRHLGADVHCYSIKPSSSGAAVSVLGRSLVSYLVAVILTLFQKPGRFGSTWLLALKHRPLGLKGLLWAQFHFVEAMTLSRLMSNTMIERLHSHFANSGASVAMLSCHYLQIPWSLTLHGISETDHPAGQLLGEKLRRADFVACASYFMQAQAMRMSSPDEWRKFHIVRCGVPEALLHHPPTPRRTEAVPKLLCVGRLSPEKGHAGLLTALATLKAEGITIKLKLVGDGTLRQALGDEAEQLGLRAQVEFSGFMPEDRTLAEMAEADVIVLPSLMEGLPVVLIEAMALGKPVVAPCIAGIPELVEHHASGLLFTPSSWKDLTAQLRAMTVSYKDWTKMGAAGRDRVAEEFTIEKSGKRMLSLFVKAKLHDNF